MANPDPSALASTSQELYGRVRLLPLGPNPGGRTGLWTTCDALDGLVEERSGPLGARPGDAGDRKLVLEQVVREATSVIATAAVGLWVRQRRLLDWSAANVRLTAGPMGVEVGVLDASLTVVAGDPVAGQRGTRTATEGDLLDELAARSLGGEGSAIGLLIATCRATVRTGDRHLWGNVALAAGNALVHAADTDRDRLWAARPDLLRTIELIDTGRCTFPLRRTCCLLLKLPPAQVCSTCSLGDRAEQVRTVGAFYGA